MGISEKTEMTEMQDDDRLDLGDDHALIFASYQDDKRVGAHIKHNKPDGTPFPLHVGA